LSARLSVVDEEERTVFEGNPCHHAFGSQIDLVDYTITVGEYKSAFQLQPQEEAVWSFATGFVKSESYDGKAPKDTVLFSRPGKYRVRVRAKDITNVVDVEGTVEIAPFDPQDTHFINILRDDSELREAMLSPIHDVRDDLRPTLEAIVKSRPKSSYANYARLAIARSYLYGDGTNDYSAPVERRNEAFAFVKRLVMQRLEKSIETGKLWPPEFVQWSTFPRRQATTLPLLRTAYDGMRTDNQEAVEKSVNKICEIGMPDEARRRAAQAWLDEITDTNFPYYPAAVAISIKNARSIDPLKSKAMETVLRDTAPGSSDSLMLTRLMRPKSDPRCLLVVKVSGY
jgi:hypothetical protein